MRRRGNPTVGNATKESWAVLLNINADLRWLGRVGLLLLRGEPEDIMVCSFGSLREVQTSENGKQ